MRMSPSTSPSIGHIKALSRNLQQLYVADQLWQFKKLVIDFGHCDKKKIKFYHQHLMSLNQCLLKLLLGDIILIGKICLRERSFCSSQPHLIHFVNINGCSMLCCHILPNTCANVC